MTNGRRSGRRDGTEFSSFCILHSSSPPDAARRDEPCLATVTFQMEPRNVQDLATKTVAPAPADLEIKDAQLIFNQVWKQLEKDYGRPQLRFPKELILLGGAPGAGKGTNTDFICELR